MSSTLLDNVVRLAGSNIDLMTIDQNESMMQILFEIASLSLIEDPTFEEEFADYEWVVYCKFAGFTSIGIHRYHYAATEEACGEMIMHLLANPS
jgi:hypothetical protein